MNADQRRRLRARKPVWPDDPYLAEVFRLVALYGARGYTRQQIADLCSRSITPGLNPVTTQDVSLIQDALLAIYKHDALDGTETVFAHIDHTLTTLIEESWRLYDQSAQIRVAPSPAPGIDPVVIPPASYRDRVAILSAIQRTVAARALLHFGSKSGTQITIQNTTLGPGAVLNPETIRSLDLRQIADRLATEQRQLLLQEPPPPIDVTPSRESTSRDSNPDDDPGDDALLPPPEHPWQHTAESVVDQQGASGRTTTP
jgi:hypothetical protein